MEAVALWDFKATQADEMSFCRGERIYVTNTDEGGWYKAVKGSYSGFIPATYIKMEAEDWYREKTSRTHAERLLLQTDSFGNYLHSDGVFLIRKSESDPNGFALSAKHEDTVQHFRILIDQATNKFYIWPKDLFYSIKELVAHYHDYNCSGNPAKEIKLKDMVTEMFEAMYDFAPANQEEIQLKRGDRIRLVAKSDENWWEGEVNGQMGFFPKNYVKKIN